MHDKAIAGDLLQTVSSSDFDNVVLSASGPVAVEFMSYSCAHCRAIESSLQQVAQMVRPQQIFRVNVALEPVLAAHYSVHGTPTLVMFKDGAEVARVEGPPPDVTSLLRAVTMPFRE